jgi:1-deoxyxylulose-5-phosphate synthase
MDAAWESGLAWFDTAGAYGGGRSEQAIGRWIASRGVRPRLTTKTFNPMGSGADHGLKPERTARQLRSSLERLGVDHVELYLAHDYDPDVPLAEAMGAFQAAQDDGLIGGYGVSNFDARQLEAALAAGTPRAVQNAVVIPYGGGGLTGRAGTGNVVCVVSGGNINLSKLCEILGGAAG